MPDIFLSYSRDDQATARRFAEGFERAGFSVWWDQTLNPGEHYDRVTEKALAEAKAVVVLWSRKSVDSHWVRAEATQAHANGTLVPVMIESCKRPIMFELTHTMDLSHWKGNPGDKDWQSYVAGVRRFVEKDAGTTSPPAPLLAMTHTRHVSPVAYALIVAGLLAVGIGIWMLTRTAGRPAVNATDASVAVLPFRDMSPGKDQEYFADGITEEILNSLAGLKDLKVTGRTSSFAYKDKDVDLRTIGETLGVKNILEGSVRKAGNQLRITAQLNDANTGFHLWSKTYERPMDDIFRIQEDIAKSVAQALQISMGIGELGTRPGGTRNIDAYDAYLAATAFSEPTSESLRAAMPLLERATTLDPSFVDAWVYLANVYAFASTNQLPGDSPEGWAQKADLVFERIRGISEFGEYMYEGLVGDRSQNALNLVDAQRHFENSRAIAQKSKAGFEGNRYKGDDAIFVLATGRFRAAITLLERDRSLDPLNGFVAFLLSKAYAATGNLAAAIAEDDRGMKLSGFRVPLGTGAVLNALATRDRRQIEQRLAFVTNAEADPSGFYTAMKSRLDDPAEALKELRRRAKADTNQVLLSQNAVWMAYFGDPAGALEIYRTHADLFRSARRSAILFDVWSPLMHDMRMLPGFKDLAREMGLVDYWRTYGWGDLCKPVGTDDFECT